MVKVLSMAMVVEFQQHVLMILKKFNRLRYQCVCAQTHTLRSWHPKSTLLPLSEANEKFHNTALT